MRSLVRGGAQRWVRRTWRSATRIWRRPAALVAVIASFALPAFSLTAAAMLHDQAVDELARRAIAESVDGLDVTVLATGSMTAASLAPLDEELAGRLSEWPAAGRLARTLIIPEDAGAIGRPVPTTDLGGAASVEPIVGGGARIVAREGALGALDVVSSADVDGLWISQRYAERTGLQPADTVVVGSGSMAQIAGVYEDLWEPGRDDYWSDAPAILAPSYSRVLRAPAFEVIFADDQVLFELDATGVARWDLVIDDVDTREGLRAQTAAATRLRRSATASVGLSNAVARFAGPGGPVPDVRTESFDVLAATDVAAEQLRGPLAAAMFGGAALGLVVVAVGAAFATRQRLDEIRLLRGDGDGLPRLALTAAAEYAPPAALGSIIGVAVAPVVVGDPRDRAAHIDAGVLIVTGVGLAVVGCVVAFAAWRSLDASAGSIGAPRVMWFLPLVAVAAVGWVQLGELDGTAAGALVVGLPIAALLGGVGLVTVALRALAARGRSLGRRMPSPLFLAWRRTTAADAGPALLATGLGVSLGLVVLAVSISASISASTAAKATTIVGGVTQATVATIDELPPTTTAIGTWTTRSTVTDRSVQVIAIDPATYAGAVSWDTAFGSSPAAVVDRLTSSATAGDLPVIVAGPRSVAGEGGIGTDEVLGYVVVDRLASAPLASTSLPTLIVSGPDLTARALDVHRQRRPDDVAPDDWDAEFRSPLARSTTVLVSQLPAPELASALRATGVDDVDIRTRAGALGVLDDAVVGANLAALRMLAAVAAVAAVGALAFSQFEQHARRRLSTAMARRMGLSKRSAALAIAGEIAGATTVAFVAGATIAVGVSRRLFPPLEPDRVVPPDVGALTPWGALGLLGAMLVALIATVAYASARAIERTTYAEVLRDR